MQIGSFDIYAFNSEDRNFTVLQLKTFIAFKMDGSGHTRYFKTAKLNDLMVKWSKVKTNNIPHISDHGVFEEAEEAQDKSNNLPTSTEAMESFKGHKQCERRQQINSSGCVDPSMVDGDDNVLDIIEKGGICL